MVQIGYKHGMNFIAATLLFHASEEIAYWLFITLMEDYEVMELYLPDGLELFKHCQSVDKLIEKKHHDLSSFLSNQKLTSKFFFFDWILTLFTSIASMDFGTLIFNNFFKFGWKFLYSFMYEIIIDNKKEIMKRYDVISISDYISMNIENELIKNFTFFRIAKPPKIESWILGRRNNLRGPFVEL